MWVDGVYVKAGLEKEKAATLVVLAALSDGSKVVVTAVPGYRESTEGWSDMLRDLKERAMECAKLIVGDGRLGIGGALRNIYPQAAEQRCWNHKSMCSASCQRTNRREPSPSSLPGATDGVTRRPRRSSNVIGTG